MLFWWPWPCHIIVCLIHYLKYFRFRCVFSKSARLISGSYSCWVREDVRSSGSPTTLNRSSKTTLEQEIRFNMTPKKNCHPKTKSSEKIDDSCLPIRNLSKDLKKSLTLLMAQWVDMKAQKSRTQRMLVREYPNWGWFAADESSDRTQGQFRRVNFDSVFERTVLLNYFEGLGFYFAYHISSRWGQSSRWSEHRLRFHF